MSVADESLVSARKTETILKAMKKSVRRDAALAQNKETIAGLVILTYTNPPAPPEGPAVSPPVPPTAGYVIPAGATSVTNGATLITQLATSPAKDIVCESGTYDNSTYFTNANGHRIYSRTLYGAVFTAGFNVPGANALFRGLDFDVSSQAKCLAGGIINCWSNGTACTVNDCRFDGNFIINYGIKDTKCTGSVYQRIEFYNLYNVGLYSAQNLAHVAYGGFVPAISTISDIYGEHITQAVPGSSNTDECVIFIGQPVTNGVTRIKARGCARKCVEFAGNSRDTLVTHLDLDPRGVGSSFGMGIYLEHYCEHQTFQYFQITGAERGFNMEWDNGTTGNAGAHFINIYDGVIDAANASTYVTGGHTYGMNCDQGTEAVVTDRVTFIGQDRCAVQYNGPYNGVAPVLGASNVYQMLPGATQTRIAVWPN